MRFNQHYEIEGRHAFLGASKYHWIRYDLEKMKRIWENQFASERGNRQHKLAAMLIKERVRLPEDPPTTLALYVNDAIGFRMTPEVPLVFNENGNCFGTPDAIGFYKGVLRIHDLKTGVHPASFDQILVYMALFCAEYVINPFDIEMLGRIYQNNEFYEMQFEPDKVMEVIQKMREFDKEIEKMKELNR